MNKTTYLLIIYLLFSCTARQSDENKVKVYSFEGNTFSVNEEGVEHHYIPLETTDDNLFADNPKEQGDNKKIDVIDFDNTTTGEIRINDIEYIPLETMDHSLLGTINKVIFKNNKFYILDKGQNKGVYIFDKKGKFISSIVRSGDGPGEYIEIMDMDVDNDNNVYIADNARTNIIKYTQADPDKYEIIPIGEHFMEFAYLNEQYFILCNMFTSKGQTAKLARFDRKDNAITPILEKGSSDVNEMNILKCSQHYLYRSNEEILYNERFTPYIYSIAPTGKLTEKYMIHSNHYIQEEKLKGLEKNPMKFMQETSYIKDIICLYENKDYFLCLPFIKPSATYLLIPQREPQTAKRIDLAKQDELQGASLIIGTADNRFIVSINYSESLKEKLKDKLKSWSEESNPLLVLFSFNIFD